MSRFRMVLAAFFLCFAGSACVASQNPDDAMEWTPWHPRHVPAGPLARRLLPYALLSEQAYKTLTYDSHQAVEWTRPCPNGSACPGRAGATALAERMLSNWRYLFGRNEKYHCKRRLCGAPLTGLGYQVWARRGAICKEIVLAFRGTQQGRIGDWLSNLRWVTRVLPVYDEYEQTEDNLEDILKRARQDPCYRPGVTRFVAVGHSLGGGLAQFAAYSHPGFRVYAFDPSFVTGYFNWPIAPHVSNSRGLKIERVYEHGEILQYPRYVAQTVVPPSTCNPRIVNIRFNVLKGGLADQHGLASFITGLLVVAKASAPERRPLVDEPCVGR